MERGDDGSRLPNDRTRIVGEFCSTRLDLGDEWNVRRELSKSAIALSPFRVVWNEQSFQLNRLESMFCCKAGFFYPRTSVLLHKTFSNNWWDQKQKYNRQTVKINFAAATEQGEQTICRYWLAFRWLKWKLM